MKTIGERIIDAVIKTGAIERVEDTGNGLLFVWAANSPEQLEAAFMASQPESVKHPVNTLDNDALACAIIALDDKPEKDAAIRESVVDLVRHDWDDMPQSVREALVTMAFAMKKAAEQRQADDVRSTEEGFDLPTA